MRRGSAVLAGVVLLGAALAGCGQAGPPRSPAEIAAESSFAASLAQSQDQPSEKSILWIGDGYPAGTIASASAQGEACLTATTLRLICNLDVQAGTGFVANGHDVSASYSPLIGRLPGDVAKDLANFIVIDAGRSDPGDSPTERAAVDGYLRRLHAAFPEGHYALIAPYVLGSSSEPLGRGFVAYLQAEAVKFRFAGVVDPVAEGWPRAASPTLLTDGGLTPTPAGARYISAHLTPDLVKLGF